MGRAIAFTIYCSQINDKTNGFSLRFRWIYKVNRAEAKATAEIATALEKTTDKKPGEHYIQNDGNLSVITDIKSL